MKRPFSSTRMKWIIFLLLISTLQQSCTNDKNSSNIIIKKSQETISTTDTITVKLFADYYGKRLPEFYILAKDSTKFYLPFDKKMNCAIFKAGSKKPGEFKYMGRAEYYDKKGNLKKENFLISFVVK